METLSSKNHQQFKETHHYNVSILLPNSPDRKALIEHILRDLEKIPFVVKIRTPEQLIGQKLAAYLQDKSRGDRIQRHEPRPVDGDMREETGGILH
jgi:hypothetical protein